jgi:hypothetical protein
MTMHDDSQLELLERDLKALAEPREEDERVRLAVRRQLAAGVAPRPRRPPMRIALGTAAAAVAAAAIAVVAFVGTAGSGGPTAADAAVIHHALAAVTWPANAILHEQVVDVQAGTQFDAQWWQETSPPYASRGIKAGGGHQSEFGDNGTTSFEYDPATNTISEHPDSSSPTFTDPLSEVRQQLASGQAQVAGTVVIAGASLYKIELPHGVIGYFDTTDYQPRYLDVPQQDGSVARLRVVAYEYLPMTASNRALLSVTTQHPTASIVASSNRGSSTNSSGK